MKNIIFCDIEASFATNKIKELGAVYKNSELRTTNVVELNNFLSLCKSEFICGHNFIDFDLQILKHSSIFQDLTKYHFIDTLPLSLLLFNEKTLHSLPKDYKSEDDFSNNPVEDSKISSILLDKLFEKFKTLTVDSKNIFYSLLKDNIYFSGFFKYISDYFEFENLNNDDLYSLIKIKHSKSIKIKSI